MEHLETLYLEDIAGISPCTEEEREELLERVVMMDKAALNRLVEGHLYLVPELAAAYGDDLSKDKREELISEGNTALFMGVYEYEGGNFVAYIRERIAEAMEALLKNIEEDEMNAKRIAAKVNLVSEAGTFMAAELGREASAEELAKRLGMQEDEVREALEIAISAVNNYTGEDMVKESGDDDDPLLREANELLREEEEEKKE